MPGKAANPLIVYRILHFDNLAHVFKNGLYIRNHPSSDPDYINIGNSAIINTRETFPVKIYKYGCLGDYIPFYFGTQSIMLYNILTGHGGLKKYPPDNIVYLCCFVEDLVKTSSKYFFTDGQANKKFTKHFTELSDLNNVDWEIVNSSDFRMTEEDPDRPRKYQAEFLVYKHVPVSCISKIVVYNRKRKNDVKSLLDNNGLDIEVNIANKDIFYFYF